MYIGRGQMRLYWELRMFAEFTTARGVMKEKSARTDGLGETSVLQDDYRLSGNTKLRPGFVLDHLHTIRIASNKMNHENYNDPHHAAAMILRAFALGVWLMRTYGEPGFIPQKFRCESVRDEVKARRKPVFSCWISFSPMRRFATRRLET